MTIKKIKSLLRIFFIFSFIFLGFHLGTSAKVYAEDEFFAGGGGFACMDTIDNDQNGLTDCADPGCTLNSYSLGDFAQPCDNCAQQICDTKNVGDACGGPDVTFDNSPFITVAAGTCFKPNASNGTGCGPSGCLCVPSPSMDVCPCFTGTDIQNSISNYAGAAGQSADNFFASLRVSGCMLDEATAEGMCGDTDTTNLCLTSSLQVPNCANKNDPNYDPVLCQNCMGWSLPSDRFHVPGMGLSGCGTFTPTWARGTVGSRALFGILLHDVNDTVPTEQLYAANNNSCVSGSHNHDGSFGGQVAFLTASQSQKCLEVLAQNSCQCVTDQKATSQLNHGNFVTCEVKALKDAGLENRGDLKKMAAQSACMGYK